VPGAQFTTLLTNYYRSIRGKFKVPIFAHVELDLHKVWWEVQARGGYESVTKDKLWKVRWRMKRLAVARVAVASCC
jgi:ARID/BRIGHT DNA binding domain